MKRILVIYPTYQEEVTGGQAYDRMVIEALQKSPSFEVDFLLDKDLFTRSKYLYNFAYLVKFFSIKKYDYVLTNSRLYTRLIVLFSFLKWRKVKTITIHHHFNFLGESGFKRKIHQDLELSFLRYSWKTIIPSPYIKDLFQELLPASTFVYMPLGVDKSECDSKIVTKKIGEVTQLLYVGTIEKRKGLVYLIEALHMLKTQTQHKFQLHLVGKVFEPDYKTLLDEKIQTYGLTSDVIFHGRLSLDELRTQYEQADIFTFPSLLEGYGMVLLEAMSYALPIIAFNNSAMPYTVKNDVNGILVENESAASFCQAICKMIEQPDYYQTLVANAQKQYASIPTKEDLRAEIQDWIQKLEKE